MHVFMFEGYVALVVLLGMLAVKSYAFANALLWPSAAYALTHKLSKAAWLGLLGIGLLADLLLMSHPAGLVSVAFLVVALVYVVDVRPAVAAVTRRR